jgi:magnesium-transporting ATPase (P-type)
VILAILLLNGVLGCVQEARAEEAVAALREIVPDLLTDSAPALALGVDPPPEDVTRQARSSRQV